MKQFNVDYMLKLQFLKFFPHSVLSNNFQRRGGRPLPGGHYIIAPAVSKKISMMRQINTSPTNIWKEPMFFLPMAVPVHGQLRIDESEVDLVGHWVRNR